MNHRQLQVIEYLREENRVLIARNLTDSEDGILTGKRYLIHDRDPLFTAEFLSVITETGVESVKLPPRSPNLNAVAERFVRSIKESCLNRMIFFWEESQRKAVENMVNQPSMS